MEKIQRDFYAKDGRIVARALLGQILVTRLPEGETSALIVECEAYLGRKDKAAHSFRGKRTPRNETLFGPPGYAYVYLIYGLYHCFNIVAGALDDPQAVLIRALEPLTGLDLMRQRRKKTDPKLLSSGPGRLTQAMGITRELNGADLLGETIFISPGAGAKPSQIAAAKRIGVDYAEEWAAKPLRFYLRDNLFVSKL